MKNVVCITSCAIVIIILNAYSVLGATSKEYKTKTGKIIVVTENHPQGASLSNISIAFKDNESSVLRFNDMDPISNVLLADLDNNGFDEIYIITLSAGSGSYGNVIGIASTKDKSLTKINFPELTESDLQIGAKYEGYEGHDIYKIKGKLLIRSFPVKTPKSTTRMIKYKLIGEEAALQLVIIK
jgi:hypothetical protein